MDAPTIERRFTAQLAEQLGCSAADHAWLANVVELFPVPSAQHLHHVVFAIHRLIEVAPWLAPVIRGDGALDRVVDGMRKAHREGRLAQASGAGAFRGDFLRAGTLMQEQDRPAKHLEILRAIVLACAWRWSQTPRARTTSVDALSRAIRGLASGASRGGARSGSARNASVEGELLAALVKMAGSPRPSVPPRATNASHNEAFRNAWNEHALPELESILAGTPVPTADGPRPTGGGQDTGGAPYRPGGLITYDGHPELVRQLEGYRRRLGETGQEAELEPGESLEEVVAPVDVLPALFEPRNRDARAVARYQVKQANWGRNRYLLPNHPDALQLEILGRVVGETLALINSGSPVSRAGLSGLLLQAVTGRTVKSLKALRVLESGSEDPDPDRFDLLLGEGELRYSVFWQAPLTRGEAAGYFQPSAVQKVVLEHVKSVYCLPLVPPVLQALREAAVELRRLVALDPVAIEAEIRRGAQAVKDRSGVLFTPAQVRASFAVHVFERSRDLALTQLLAADTLGQSTAPLSYYAPDTTRLRNAFWEFQQSLVDAEVGSEPRQASYRVGSMLQVRPKVAAEMVRTFGAPLRQGVSQLIEAGLTHQVHEAITGHVLGMLVAGLTHRPTEALFKLRRGDFLVENQQGAALFRDKIVDGAHDPRLVALPPLACRQLDAYLAHLEALGRAHPELAHHIEGVLGGESPLFFTWDGGPQHGELDLSRWKARLSEAWRLLPLNWGRHWCRTKAVELGVAPELVTMQMGHLEAAGYPFSGASPTEPAAFVEALAPKWEVVLRSQGWQLLRGLSSPGVVRAPCFPPLRTWSEDAAQHAARQADAWKEWRAHFISTMRSMRERALADVLTHPDLVRNGIPERYADTAKGQPPHALSRSDFERIRDEQMDDGDVPLELGLARASALCRVARVVNRRTGQSTEDPPRLLFPRRPLDNAFFPGLLTAVGQVRAMREYVSEWSRANKPGPWRDFPLACARTTVALTLFGFCEDPAQISGAIARRGLAHRSASFPDLLFVPYGDEPHEVLPLRGVAALAMAQLASKHGPTGFPGWQAIAPHLSTFLPIWAWPASRGFGGELPGIVRSLCETVAAANRFELSPAAQKALGSAAICTQAHMLEQIALLDGDPAGSLRQEWAESVVSDSPDAVPKGRVGVSTGSARTQYLALHETLPTGDDEVLLPLTGAVIPSGEAALKQHRAAIVAEIDAMLDEEEPKRRLQPVVRLLAAWCKDMLLNGTERTPTPAISTISTYLGRLGGPLVEALGHRSLDQVDEQELEHAYMAAVESKRNPAQAASRALSLHRFGQKHCGLPDIDRGLLQTIANVQSTTRADARLILPSERSAAIALLDEWASGRGESPDPERLRKYRQARMYGELILPTGARRTEILGLAARDVSLEDEGVRIRIRPNPSRRLKTPNARRDLATTLPADRLERVRAWLSAESQRLPAAEASRAYLFAPVDKARSAEGRSEIATVCISAVKAVTQIRDARLHHFRHLFAIEAMTPVFLTPDDRRRLQGKLDLADTPTWNSGIAFPRDLMAMAVLLGHGDPKTTLMWYHHVVFLLRSRPDAVISTLHTSIGVCATLLGVTRDAPKAALKGRGAKDRVEYLLNQRLKPRSTRSSTPVAKAVSSGQFVGPPQRWSARRMATLLDAANRAGRLEPALLAMGGNPARANVLRGRILALELRLGRRLVADAELERISPRPRRQIRPMSELRGLEQWWDVYDEDAAEERQRIVSVAGAVDQHMSAADADWIRIPEELKPALAGLLVVAGIQADQLEWEQPGAGSVRLRINRKGRSGDRKSEQTGSARSGGPDGYLGLSLKRIVAVLSLAGEPL